MMLFLVQLFRMRSVLMSFWLHHLHQVLQVAQRGLLCGEEGCQEVHSHHWMYQGTKRGMCPREVCSVEKKAVKKYTPITGCTKEPREVCAPAGCGFKEGEEQCYDKTQTIVQDAPKEECNLEPQRTCA